MGSAQVSSVGINNYLLKEWGQFPTLHTGVAPPTSLGYSYMGEVHLEYWAPCYQLLRAWHHAFDSWYQKLPTQAMARCRCLSTEP